MPTYDYVCDACDHKFEHFQGINDPLLKKCPTCKKPKLRRLFGSGGAIMFKGSGFYITDYRSDSYKQGAAADKKVTETSSDSKSTESKPSETKSSEAKPEKASNSSKSNSTPKTGSKPKSPPKGK